MTFRLHSILNPAVTPKPQIRRAAYWPFSFRSGATCSSTAVSTVTTRCIFWRANKTRCATASFLQSARVTCWQHKHCTALCSCPLSAFRLIRLIHYQPLHSASQSQPCATDAQGHCTLLARPATLSIMDFIVLHLEMFLNNQWPSIHNILPDTLSGPVSITYCPILSVAQYPQHTVRYYQWRISVHWK
jgi:hypothetical protein